MERLTIENFEEKVEQNQGVFIIKFFSETCGPCETMAPVVEAFEANNSNIKVYEVDTMESPDIAARFGVRGVPYVAFCEGREVLYDFTGVRPLADMQFIIDHIDDPYFRENGEFQKTDSKKSYLFPIIVTTILVAYFFILCLPA